MTEDEATLNTDRELWRERDGDYYADSLFVTSAGGVGFNCGGNCIVKPIRVWHESDSTIAALRKRVEELERRQKTETEEKLLRRLLEGELQIQPDKSIVSDQ